MFDRFTTGLGASACALALAATSAWADPVTLTTTDGTYSIAGDLIGLTDDTYVIKSRVGTISIGRDTVTCVGTDCPEGSSPVPLVAIVGDHRMGAGLVPTLLSAFAGLRGGGSTVLKTIDGGLLVELAGGDLAETSAIKIMPAPSAEGIAALLGGTADLALSDRRALTREVRAAVSVGLGDLRSGAQEQIVALDGLVFLTHPRNPVRALSPANAAAIFAGRITNWAEIGGSNGPITLYTSTPDLGSAEVLETLVMKPAGLTVSAAATVLGSDRVVAEAVAKDPAAIGYARIGNDQPARALAVTGTCGIQVQPTVFAAKTEEYPLTRQLFMYRAQQDLSPVAQDFSDFLRSEAAQAEVAAAGFIDQSISSATIDQQGMRLASALMVNTEPDQQAQLRGMMDMLLSAERLSATFRHETGSDNLNARALADLDRLASLLSTDAFIGKEILFLGFTDTLGNADLNRQISQDRAEQVVATLLKNDPELANEVRLTAIGYGEISSLACNDTDAGRDINRRVETWVREYVQ